MYRSKTLILLENRILFLLREHYCMLSPRNWKWEIPLSQKFQKKRVWCNTFSVDIYFADENIHIHANFYCLSLNLLCKSRQVQNPIYILDEKFCEVVSEAWEEWLGNNCQKWSICFSKLQAPCFLRRRRFAWISIKLFRNSSLTQDVSSGKQAREKKNTCIWKYKGAKRCSIRDVKLWMDIRVRKRRLKTEMGRSWGTWRTL